MQATVDPVVPHRPTKSVSRRLLDRARRYLHADLEETVLCRELGGNAYRFRTSLELVEADRETVRRFCAEQHVPRAERAQLASYLDNHYHGLFASLDGTLIGHVWWHDDRLPAANRHPHLSRLALELAPREVWSFDLFIAAEHRGGGVASDFFARFRQYLERAGYTRVYGHVTATNLPAVWLHKMQGYKPVKTVRSQVLLERVLVTGGRVYVKNPTRVVGQRFDYRRIA